LRSRWRPDLEGLFHGYQFPNSGELGAMDVLIMMVFSGKYEDAKYKNFWEAYDQFVKANRHFRYQLGVHDVLRMKDKRSPSALLIGADDDDMAYYRDFKRRNPGFRYSE